METEAAVALLSQIRMVISLEQLAISVPRSLMEQSVTGPVCPINLLGRAFGRRDHVRTVPSWEDDTNCFKFGWKMAFVILSVCPGMALSMNGSAGSLFAS